MATGGIRPGREWTHRDSRRRKSDPNMKEGDAEYLIAKTEADLADPDPDAWQTPQDEYERALDRTFEP